MGELIVEQQNFLKRQEEKEKEKTIFVSIYTNRRNNPY